MNKKQYEQPWLEIKCFEPEEFLSYSNPTDWIPDTDDDDVFGNL